MECERGGTISCCEEVIFFFCFFFFFFCGQVLTTFGASRWENEGHLSRAACWLVFTRQYSKAVDILMRSDGMTVS